MKRFCPNCGHPIKRNAAFCPNCGFKLKPQTLAHKTKAVSIAVTRESFNKKSPAVSKRLKVILSLTAVALVIVFAGLYFVMSNRNDNAQPKRESTNNSRVIKKPSHTQLVGHLSSTDHSPQRTGAVILAYSGKKYPEEWSDALDNAKSNEWQIHLKNQSDYPYMHPGKVVYMVSNDLGYTLKPLGDDEQIYIFADKKQIGSALFSQMVNYLNHHNGQKVVNSLQSNEMKTDDETSKSSDTQVANGTSTDKKKRLAGDGGFANMPSAMQGSWYSSYYGHEIGKLNIKDHEISWKDGNDEGVEILHKMNNSYPKKISATYRKATQDWFTVGSFESNEGIHWLNVRGWTQSAGDGDFYGLHHEKGQQVLVHAGGADLHAEEVYWKTPALARKYRAIKFKDLRW